MTTTTGTESKLHAKLIEALSQVDRPGEVCSGGDRPLTLPGLEVDGLGTVGLPLGTTQARQLIKRCRQAPYGRGTETVVDTDVRRVWELDPLKFQLANPKWDEFVASIVADVQRELGLEDRKLAAHLYKLLVYEKGSFFLPHRDGEKLDRMVATLVIGLPSVHEGGELIVWHDGQQHEINFAGAAKGYELSYAAFYADCQHEVRPLRSGYRICLTYNVTLAKSRGKRGIAAPSHGVNSAAIGELLRDWQGTADSGKIAVTLDHRYTQDGLTIDNLKGIDRVRAEVLFEAAEQADCVAHLALVTLWQSGSAEGGYDDYSYGNYSWSNDDEDDDRGNSGSEYEMGEIIDDNLSVNHWSDRQGQKVLLGEFLLDEDEIVSGTAMEDEDPSQEDFEGPTGNAGMTLERWYHRAAIVIWPRAQHFSVLCGAGTDAAVGGLQPLVRRLKRVEKAKREVQREDCLTFADAIVDSWQPSRHRCSWEKTDDVDRGIFLPLLQELDDPDLVRRFLSQVMPRDAETQLDKSFAKFCKKHGWAGFEAELAAVIEAATAATIARNAQLLQTLCLARDKNVDRIALCTRLAERAVRALEAFDSGPSENDWRVKDVDRAALLVSLVRAMLEIDAVKPLLSLIEHTLARTDKYDLTDAHLAAIYALESRLTKRAAANRAISHWLSGCRSELEHRTMEAPQKPRDYRRPHELPCECGDCRELSQFLANPDQRVHRFAVRKDRRRHLHNIINTHRCDLTHVTERRGSPHTLVCTKTTASYEAACEIHARDVKNLSRIVAMEKKID